MVMFSAASVSGRVVGTSSAATVMFSAAGSVSVSPSAISSGSSEAVLLLVGTPSGQAISVHAAIPSGPPVQVQVLHPSGAVYDSPGQKVSSLTPTQVHSSSAGSDGASVSSHFFSSVQVATRPSQVLVHLATAQARSSSSPRHSSNLPAISSTVDRASHPHRGNSSLCAVCERTVAVQSSSDSHSSKHAILVQATPPLSAHRQVLGWQAVS
mmetsp:Transcript_11981/g.25359  ORF Transcript_11981/g.25359 Transcript_11981/m.25359 type:complete len:211 (+) Transcript_11981:2988-3620(+)